MGSLWLLKLILSSCAVMCLAFKPNKIEIRLVSGTKHSGRVEVRYKPSDPWGTICDRFWRDTGATVACRMLGFKFGKSYRSAYFGQGKGPIYMNYVRCKGSETSLTQCHYSGWKIHSCTHREDAGVACFSTSVAIIGSLQDSSQSGAVVIRDAAGWKPVCDVSWDDSEAAVVCRELGYRSGKSACCSRLSRITYNPYMYPRVAYSKFQCQGTEKTLLGCKHAVIRQCENRHLASVACYTQPIKDVDMEFQTRLSNGSTNWGTIEIKYQGIWGRICSPDWTKHMSTLVCISHGFRYGMNFGRSSEIGDLPIWVSIVNGTCPDNTTSLKDCVTSSWGEPVKKCYPNRVLCFNNKTAAPTLRLIGPMPNVGRVEMTFDGETGTICDTYWTNVDARVICRQLGYMDGTALTGSYYGKGRGPVFMDRVWCKGDEKDVWQCRTRGWKVSARSCGDHTKDASVVCVGTVKLVKGDHSHGIVQVIYKRGRYLYWLSLCGKNFTNTEASVVCRQLGFRSGTSLPSGSYGRMYQYFAARSFRCRGNETSIQTCAQHATTCSTRYTYGNGYSAVACNNGSVSNETSIRLVGGAAEYDIVSGRVQMVKNGVKGRICMRHWDDRDANVTCRQLGHGGGVAYRFPSPNIGPYLMSQVQCSGFEISLSKCKTGSKVCNIAGEAGVLCYKKAGTSVRLKLVGGTRTSGRVEVEYGGTRGTICMDKQTRWTGSRNARVVCRHLGFKDGSITKCVKPFLQLYLYQWILVCQDPFTIMHVCWFSCRGEMKSVKVSPVFMSHLQCYGVETSVFQCRNSGWGYPVSAGCRSHDHDLRVQCYRNGKTLRSLAVKGHLIHVLKVRLTGGESSLNRVSGVVWFLDHGIWQPICTSGFDQRAAKVVCQELHLAHAVSPPLGTFKVDMKHQYMRLLYIKGKFVNNIKCTGLEKSLAACSYKIGRCKKMYNTFAFVICTSSKLSDDIQLTLDKIFPSPVTIKQYGFNASVCDIGWSDRNARVTCKQSGYVGGITFKLAHDVSTWSGRFLGFGCYGNETDLNLCQKYMVTRVVFFIYSKIQYYKFADSRPKIRLVNSNSTATVSSGRVEIYLNGKWGTICDPYWTKYDAMVVCRQLGFMFGVPAKGFGFGAGPSWLFGVTCSGREDSVWRCPYRGFHVNNTVCDAHKFDVAVQCNDVRLWPRSNIGAVEVYDGRSSYGMICSDNFTAVDAAVICRERGYRHGVHLCCSAFGPQPNSITITRLRCTGRELTLRDCPMEKSLTYCPSMLYASVVCSFSSPKSGYRLILTRKYYGRVRVYHMGAYGDVCPDNFDDRDASVVCREMGYKFGFSFNQYKPHRGQRSAYFYWLGQLGCNGTESAIAQCRGMKTFGFGHGNYCSGNGFAAVYCYNKAGDGIKFRLANRTGNSGRVEVYVNRQWGTVCGDATFTDSDALVACRQLGYMGGISRGGGAFGRGSGPVLVFYMGCTGNESSMMQCPMYFMPGYRPTYTCKSHMLDAAVTCFDTDTDRTGYYHSVQCFLYTVRLVEGGLKNYGRVEMAVNKTWLPVCDQHFDDVMASVVCKHLGYTDGIAQCCSAVGDVIDSDHVSINSCSVGLEDLTKCSYTVGMCPTGRYASAYCAREKISVKNLNANIQVRINQDSRKSATYLGPLEIKWLPSWSLVCPDFWNARSADVACRHMSWKGGVATVVVTNTSRPVLLAAVICTGDELGLANCSVKQFSAGQSCSRRFDEPRPCAAVICYEEGIAVQLSDGSASHGRVSINYDGEVGHVCSTGFDDVAAGVVCRQLGFKDGVSSVTAYSGGNSGRVWISNVTCSGSEESIFGCRVLWNPNSPITCVAAGVICFNSARLVHGNNINYGLLKVTFGATLGAVCDTYWDDKDTSVACRELGYQYGKSLCCGAMGDGIPPVMDSVKCSGSEAHVTDCLHEIPMTTTCMGHNVAVVCYRQAPTTVLSWRLGGGNLYTGEVLVDFLNVTGRVCPDGWDQNDAHVACRELGFAKGSPYSHYVSQKYATDHGPYWTSRIRCSGNEKTLADCPMTALGAVQACSSQFSAGLQCFDTTGFFYRLKDGSSSKRGRVEVSVDGSWGTVCGQDFDDAEASVFCKTLGFVGGAVDYDTLLPAVGGAIYEADFRCSGEEALLADCPHRGWRRAFSEGCVNHTNDVVVNCFNMVRATGTSAPKEGPLQLYHNSSWNIVCDTDFDDVTASVVCREMGYIGGRSICCSAYGHKHGGQNADDSSLNWYSLICDGNENSPLECEIQPGCRSKLYTSVLCNDKDDFYDKSYRFHFASDSATSGPIIVDHYGTYGYICDVAWQDVDAQVFCNSRGFSDGIAWHLISSQYGSSTDETDLPYLASEVSCKGKERSLQQCLFHGRNRMGNCTSGSIAAAICWNKTKGISYRLSGGGKADGRVEISVGGVWGSVCDLFWDDREAGVVCRQLGFTDGYAIDKSPYGRGSGPIWLSHLECLGSESSLHQCPHSGFKEELSSAGSASRCSTHDDDVQCIVLMRCDSGSGFKSSQGAVQVYKNKRWLTVCEHTFDRDDAKMVCLSLGFPYGINVAGSKFGHVVEPIGITHVHCTGGETDFTQCSMTETDDCTTGSYASVVCDHQPIIDSGLEIRIVPDSSDSDFRGFLEVKRRGVWGDVCLTGLNNAAAQLACTDLGYTWGVTYAPSSHDRVRSRSRKMIQAARVVCDGRARSLKDCDFRRSPSSSCDFESQRAGILCSRSETIFRLSGHLDSTQGRIDMRVEGQWGMFCSSMLNPTAAAKVACKSIGYPDGLPISGLRFAQSNTPLHVWLHHMECSGKENSLLECSSDGFNRTNKNRLADQFHVPLAVRCYSSVLAITDTRLVNDVDSDLSSGRLEVYVSGPNTWGTVCGPLWTDADAAVVCRQMGYQTGLEADGGRFGSGTGRIWMSDVGCTGAERRIQNCVYSGFYVDGCTHAQDVGVFCKGSAASGLATDTNSHKHFEAQNVKSSPDHVIPPSAIAVPVVLIVLTALGVVAGTVWYRRQSKSIVIQTMLQLTFNDTHTGRYLEEHPSLGRIR
ncbi:LOW QUALITY PROTEIN: deleted in malignant brain tumors 1 protein-like [Gigantopelta aegis]|uniref:LOW QUALITY PROTEIN: deleted in malignant brain tumors 1 protein-like n=1 Tax=Gigantopelta aegis TaxID=1735272 RepID=UPI001B887E57|nr:LOW QUALITY PROTEIN: deleted in malignant brain tumors 1 protein-like [Gigantopelta aegis]